MHRKTRPLVEVAQKVEFSGTTRAWGLHGRCWNLRHRGAGGAPGGWPGPRGRAVASCVIILRFGQNCPGSGVSVNSLELIAEVLGASVLGTLIYKRYDRRDSLCCSACRSTLKGALRVDCLGPRVVRVDIPTRSREFTYKRCQK